jgi:membrane dipeptidase
MAAGTEIEGLAGPEDYPRLFEALSDRGYSDADLHAIASENLLRVLRRTLPG